MTANYACPILFGIAAASAIGCSNPAGSGSTQAVSFHLVAATSSMSGGVAGPVTITAFRLVVGPAALGSGDQFGCVDCQDGGSEAAPGPALISVPTDGSPVMVATEQVAAGRYGSVEIQLLIPDLGLLAATPGWPAGATMEVAGQFNGAPFTLYLPILGAFREALNPPVDVPGGTTPAPLSVTVTVPVASWFAANGAALDPGNPVQRTQIEQNARNSFQPVEAGSGTENGG